MTPEPTRSHAERLLLTYVERLAERQGDGAGDGFEYALWDALGLDDSPLLSGEERDHLRALVVLTQSWVVYNLESARFEPIDLPSWKTLRTHASLRTFSRHPHEEWEVICAVVT